jgi:hypothetical protein
MVVLDGGYMTLITLTVCAIYTTIFEYKNLLIQTRILFLEYLKQVIFQYDVF